jgi:hypothetical protein
MSTVMWEVKKVCSIREIAKEALDKGFLSLEAEEQLRKMLKQKYDLDDLEAFMCLQRAAVSGTVKQESRLLRVA